jgi:hypothetical protein
VNRDASLFCRAPGSGLGARHGDVAPSDHFGNAVRHTEASSVGLAGRSPRHNKFGPGRSSCRSAPASDSPRKGTAALMLPRHETPTRLVDERHDCQDIGLAYVPGTVWGTASSQTAKFRSRRRACLLIPKTTTRHSARQSARAPISRTTTSTAERRASAQHRQPRLTSLCPPRANTGKTEPASIPRRIKADSGRHRHLPHSF